MASDKLSILEAIKDGDIQASLFTTFNANLKFYEDLVLRRLTAAGCRNNVLLMDQQQCALAHASSATRPSFAGISYTLVPIATSGAFHPKVCLLAGKKSASIFVGSHNLTISGFGYNREVTSCSRLQGKPGALERNALAFAWTTVRQWIESAELPIALRESAYQLDKAFGTTFDEDAESDHRFIAQHVGTTGLLDQLTVLAPAQVERIALIGAFFDAEGRFVEELLRRWPNARIVIGIEPDTVWLSRLPEDARLKIVDASALSERKGYLHAKAIYLEANGGRALFASGSANPSAPAWITSGLTANTEAMLVRLDAAARECGSALGLSTLSRLPLISKQALREVSTRSRKEVQASQTEAIPLRVGVAIHEDAVISLDASKLPAFDCIDACGDLGGPLESITLDWAEPSSLHVTGDLRLIRSLTLRNRGVASARVLVHHPELIARQIRSAAQEPTVDLLRALGSEMEDISRVIPALEKVIFSDSVANAMRVPGRTAGNRPPEEPVSRPDTLCAPPDETHRKSAPSLFSSSNDLAYLIEILTRHIDVGAPTQARGLDRAGRTEEEQIGQDDEGEGPDATSLQPRSSDADIGEAVCSKVKRLCIKMTKAIRNAEAGSHQAMASIVVQLVAVLALMQELSKLENADRWRVAHTALFWTEDLGPLIEVALDHLFVSETGVHVLCDGETPEEVVHLIGQLLWAAWLLDIDWWSPTGRGLGTAEQEERAVSNTRLVLLLEMAQSNDVWPSIASQIERTLPADPFALRNATRWLEKHERISKRISALGDSPSEPPDGGFSPGDIIDVPAQIERLLVAISVSDSFVQVTPGKDGRKFKPDRVRFLARV